jgi:hypothetical protein
LDTCGHHISPVPVSTHSVSFAWFHRFRSPIIDGAGDSAPPAWKAVMSAFIVRTAQL